MRRVVVGTRGSALALAQTRFVVAQLERLQPNIEFALQIIRTRGDANRTTSFAALGRGVFVHELQSALLDGRVDVAVHSLKDLPTEEPEGLMIAAVPERVDPRDVLISRHGLPLAELPKSARIGSSAARRRAQLLAYRSDFRVMPLRGNVDTRLRKAQTDEYDGIILAAAGLARLGLLDRVTEYLPTTLMLPAPGQGALAVEVRADDEAVRALVQPLDDPLARATVIAERTCLQAMGGGCSVPIAVHASIEEGKLVVDGLVADADGRRVVRARVSGGMAAAGELGVALARELLAAGGKIVLHEA
ncbi:MAG TPA: hydroxymethylbilane synthase [Anaerolineae bacterium]|nr:hydroxymethylbilane synthase [Anaerolineae bacterium]